MNCATILFLEQNLLFSFLCKNFKEKQTQSKTLKQATFEFLLKNMYKNHYSPPLIQDFPEHLRRIKVLLGSKQKCLYNIQISHNIV